MELIVGRDISSGKLLLNNGKDNSTFGENNSVPKSVSPQHCRIIFQPSGIQLRNLDINNYTYVNGQAVETKTIHRTDHIELGYDRYPLNWSIVESVVPPEANIRHLQSVWDKYEQENVRFQISERRFNTLRSATGIITMIAIALSIMTGKQSIWYMVLYGVAILASLLLTVKAYRDSSKVPQQRIELNRQFQHDYVCPHCGHFMGNQSYDVLVQNNQCPYCRTKFIH